MMMTSEPSETMKQRLVRAVKSKAVLAERSKQLQQQVEDFRKREDSMNHIASELLERQRELNFMLHRASSVLHQLQDTNLALSTEFTHIVKELPAPESEKWDETVNRVNELFKKTHELAGDLQDEIFRTTQKPEVPKIEVSQPTSEAQAVPEAVVSDPEPEIIHEAQITEEIPQVAEVVAHVAEPVIISEPASSPEPVAIVEPIPAEEPATVAVAEPEPPADPVAETPKLTVSIDELFARVESMQFEEPDEDPAARRPKRGFFAKLIGRPDDE